MSVDTVWVIKAYTVWHENFTWNLILQFYGQWQSRKIKIRKLDANLVYIYHYKIDNETGIP